MDRTWYHRYGVSRSGANPLRQMGHLLLSKISCILSHANSTAEAFLFKLFIRKLQLGAVESPYLRQSSKVPHDISPSPLFPHVHAVYNIAYRPTQMRQLPELDRSRVGFGSLRCSIQFQLRLVVVPKEVSVLLVPRKNIPQGVGQKSGHETLDRKRKEEGEKTSRRIDSGFGALNWIRLRETYGLTLFERDIRSRRQVAQARKQRSFYSILHFAHGNRNPVKSSHHRTPSFEQMLVDFNSIKAPDHAAPLL